MILRRGDREVVRRVAGNGNPPAEAKLEQALIAQQPQRTQHGVGVHARRLQSYPHRLSWSALRPSVRYRAAQPAES